MARDENKAAEVSGVTPAATAFGARCFPRLLLLVRDAGREDRAARAVGEGAKDVVELGAASVGDAQAVPFISKWFYIQMVMGRSALRAPGDEVVEAVEAEVASEAVQDGGGDAGVVEGAVGAVVSCGRVAIP